MTLILEIIVSMILLLLFGLYCDTHQACIYFKHFERKTGVFLMGLK